MKSWMPFARFIREKILIDQTVVKQALLEFDRCLEAIPIMDERTVLLGPID